VAKKLGLISNLIDKGLNTASSGLRVSPFLNIGLLKDYLGVLKPRETSLLAFVGVAAAVIAGQGHPGANPLFLALVAILMGSAALNGLTNYLDREVDARMERTKLRALPSRRIYPPQKVLPLVIPLLLAGLGLAWYLHPLALVFGLIGTVAAVAARKTAFTHPLGAISGCCPVLIGYVAVSPQFSWTIVFLALLILVWVPLHVWSLMIAYRDDFRQAGILYFPISWRSQDAVKVLFSLSVILYAISLALWHSGGFGWFYFAVANILGLTVILASYNLLTRSASGDAWRVYKLSAFPYLGLILLTMCLDFWI